MAFSDIEISTQGGKPTFLYEFHYGNSYWRYTTNDEDLEGVGLDENDDPANWIALAITDEGVTQGGSDQNDIQISIASNSPVPALFRTGQPTGKVWCKVRMYHLGDDPTETPMVWSGSITNSVYVDDATEQLAGRSLAGTYDRTGLRLTWCRQCTHPLYGVGCNRAGSNDKEDHAYPRTIATLTANSFTCTAHSEPDEGSFSGGFVEWVRDDGSFDRRAIELQDGNDFQIMGSTAGLEIGTEVTIYPGCPRTTDACILFQGHVKNYGGVPHLPGKSPFDGSPVF